MATQSNRARAIQGAPKITEYDCGEYLKLKRLLQRTEEALGEIRERVIRNMTANKINALRVGAYTITMATEERHYPAWKEVVLDLKGPEYVETIINDTPVKVVHRVEVMLNKEGK